MVVETSPARLGYRILGDLCVLIKNIQLAQVEDNYLEIEVLCKSRPVFPLNRLLSINVKDCSIEN